MRLAALLLALPLLWSGCARSDALTLTLRDFSIQPARIQARVGVPLALTIVNAGRVEHNVELDPVATGGAPLKVVLRPDERTTVTLTPITAGTFAYHCSFAGHAPAGMHGLLTVSP